MIAIAVISVLALAALGLALAPLLGLSAFWAASSARKDLAEAARIEQLLER